MLQLLYLTNTGYKLTYKICSVKAERTDRGSEKVCVRVFKQFIIYTFPDRHLEKEKVSFESVNRAPYICAIIVGRRH
jgi:hypothetical protein